MTEEFMSTNNPDFDVTNLHVIDGGNEHLQNSIKITGIKDLKTIPAEQILSGLENLVKSERKITHLVLRFIDEVARRKMYLDLGYDSLYKYLTLHLKYSGNQAYDRIDAARVLGASPKVSEKIESGQITLSQLVKVGQCLKLEQKRGQGVSVQRTENILSQVESLSVFETEKILACEFNYIPKKIQKIQPQQDGSVVVTMTLDKDQFEIIQKAQNYISHSVPNGDLADAFTFLAKKEIRRVEGKTAGKKPEGGEDKYSIPTQSFPESRLRRKSISLRTRRMLMEKANHQCQHVPAETGVRCNSRFQLQVDHVIPLAKGGADEVENLRVLCGIHNRAEAGKWGLLKKL
jgi:hypothetical protein